MDGYNRRTYTRNKKHTTRCAWCGLVIYQLPGCHGWWHDIAGSTAMWSRCDAEPVSNHHEPIPKGEGETREVEWL